MKKHIIYCYIAIFLLFNGLHNASANTSITVGYLPILDHLPLLVSHHQDNDKFQHVSITPRLFKSWAEMSGALKAGVIDAAFILSPLAMDLFNEGVPIQTVLLAHRDGSAITVKKDSTIHSASDLKGKNVAIPNRISTHTALLNEYLEGAGLSLKDINTKVIAPPNMIKAMNAGAIDAFIVAEPFGAKAQSSNVGEILALTKDIVPNHVECIVVVRTDVLEKEPVAVEEWVASLIRAGQFIDQDKYENNSRKVSEITAEKYWAHSAETIASGLQNPKDRISFSNLNPDLKDFQTIMEISLEAGIIKQTDLDNFIDASFYDKSVAH